MADINAFVSHSFLDEDAKVIEKFVRLFERVEALHPQFRWDRAIRAEPRSLSEKVVSVFEGKNALIAICTKRERIYAPRVERKVPLLNLQWVSPEDLKWKTSDWILQEIGFAKG